MEAQDAGRSDSSELRAEALRFAAGGRPILNGIDLALRPGERLGVVGPNGSGKSTLLRCLYAWCRPTGGAVYLNGTEIGAYAPDSRARELSVLAQESEGGLGLTAAEVVALGRLPHRKGWSAANAADAEAVEGALTRLKLHDLRDRSFSVLSGGEKQRVLFARALAQQPRILILDEPTNHLDIHHQLELLDVASSLGVAIVATLHDINFAARWAHRLCLMERGAIRAEGAVDVVLDPALIGAVYDVDVERDVDPRTGALRLCFYARTDGARA